MYIDAGDGVLVGSRAMIFKNPLCYWNIFIFRLRAFAAAHTITSTTSRVYVFHSASFSKSVAFCVVKSA